MDHRLSSMDKTKTNHEKKNCSRKLENEHGL